MVNTKLTLGDIAELRSYERERGRFRAAVIALRKRRRVTVGPSVALVFENRDTVRFQVQEMARAERIVTDEGIQRELDVYNPLIPEPGQLSATMFVELSTGEQLRRWLPRLVGIETRLLVRLGTGDVAREVRTVGDTERSAELARPQVASSVHYVRWALDDAEVEAFAAGPVVLAVDHPDYQHETTLAAATVAELVRDLRP